MTSTRVWRIKTVFSPNCTQTRGTVNNCVNGYTPWGTCLSCEENWAGYFILNTDTSVRTRRDNSALLRNGICRSASGFAHNRWASGSRRRDEHPIYSLGLHRSC